MVAVNVVVMVAEEEEDDDVFGNSVLCRLCCQIYEIGSQSPSHQEASFVCRPPKNTFKYLPNDAII